MELSVPVSPFFFGLNDRRSRQTELKIAVPWKSTTLSRQQKKESVSTQSDLPCENCDCEIVVAKCCMLFHCIAGDVASGREQVTASIFVA